MAVADDLQKLAALDVCYLAAPWVTTPAVMYLQGRLRESVKGNWVFTTSLGQSGVVGFDLGTQTTNWTSSESPATGLQVNVNYTVTLFSGGLAGTAQLSIVLTLSSVLSPVFSE
ncbi:MAG: hypothetical protein WBR28_21930 [Mycobacterium sp.]